MYFDDILIFSSSLEEHQDHLRQILVVLHREVFLWHNKSVSGSCSFSRICSLIKRLVYGFDYSLGSKIVARTENNVGCA